MVGGRQDDTELSSVVGDVVSVAMVLQEQAAPGQILCSDATARLVQRTVRLDAVEPVAAPRAAVACDDLRCPRGIVAGARLGGNAGGGC